MSKINKLRLSGTSYDIEDKNAAKTVELTQAQYDALSVKDPNTFYIITDAQGGDLSNYYTKEETDDLLDEKLDVTAYTPTDLTNYYTKSETSGATQISTALNGKQETLVSGTNIKTINNTSLLGSGNIDIQGGGSVTVDTELDSGSTNPVQNKVIYAKIDEVEQVTAAALNELNDALNAKQDTLSAGTNITISGNVISAEGGVNVVQTTGTSTTDVMSQDAVTTQLNNKADKSAAVGGYQFGESSNIKYIRLKSVSSGNIGNEIYYPKINGNGILTNNGTWAQSIYDFHLVETSAITSSITSASTDSQVPSAKAVYDALQEGGGEVSSAITSGDTNAVAGGAVYDRFDEVEQVTAAALNSLNDALSGKANTSAVTESINAAVSGKADTSAVTTVSDALTAHTANTTAHTTAAEKTAWDGAATNASNAITALGGLSLVKLSQAQYDALVTKDNSTLYVIVN